MQSISHIPEPIEFPLIANQLSKTFNSQPNLKCSRLQEFKSLTPKLNIKKKREFLLNKQQLNDQLLQELSEYNKNYQELEIIGSGFQSICKKIQKRENQEIYCAKINQLTLDDEIVVQLKTEYQLLSKVQNQEHCLKVFEYYQTSSYFIQITEYIDAETLFEQIISHDFTENEITSLAFTLLITLQDLHSKKIIHRDINLKNILYNKTQKILKLIDFGVAKQSYEENVMNFSAVGNSDFKSPEMIKEQQYDEKVDSWGLGLVLYSLVRKKIVKSKEIIRLDKLQQKLQFPEGISYCFLELITGLLAIKPKNRLYVYQALELPVFKF